MTDKLLSPLDKESAKYYTYLLDSVAAAGEHPKYKIRILPKFRSTQLVSGYVWVSDEIWTIREVYFEGKFDMIDFKLRNIMGEEGDEEFLPVRLDLDIRFKFMGNDLEMNADAFVVYNQVSFYNGGKRRKSNKKHSHDLTEFYLLTSDSTQIMIGREAMDELRPLPLTHDEYALYQDALVRKNRTDSVPDKSKKFAKKSTELWGQLGDVLLSSYSVNMAGIGSVKCSPLINPVMLD